MAAAPTASRSTATSPSPTTSHVRVHEVITEFESEFRLHHPQVSRVLIHPEPATGNRR